MRPFDEVGMMRDMEIVADKGIPATINFSSIKLIITGMNQDLPCIYPIQFLLLVPVTSWGQSFRDKPHLCMLVTRP